MTDPTPIATREPSAWEQTARYEALRRQALEAPPGPTARDGLVVVLCQGVAAWMDLWSMVPAPAVRAVQNERPRPSLPEETSAEVIRVLAAMALGHIREVHA
jgi:hypothetical protein